MSLEWQKNKKKMAEARRKMSEGMRKAWRDSPALQNRMNGSKQSLVQERISKSVARRWQDGAYTARLNGMLGKIGATHPGYAGGKNHFRRIAFQFHKRKCFIEGCGYSSAKIDVHHVDEDQSNFLLTNLMPLCVAHHLWENHYERKKAPFVTLRKDFQFEASHVLPWHSGHCARLHGHSYKLTVWVERRMQEQGIAVDFGDISRIVREQTVMKLDHQHLNDFLGNPTAEHILLWVWQNLSLALKGIRRMRLWETANSCAEITAEQLIRSYWWVLTDGGWSFLNRNKPLPAGLRRMRDHATR